MSATAATTTGSLVGGAVGSTMQRFPLTRPVPSRPVLVLRRVRGLLTNTRTVRRVAPHRHSLNASELHTSSSCKEDFEAQKDRHATTSQHRGEHHSTPQWPEFAQHV